MRLTSSPSSRFWLTLLLALLALAGLSACADNPQAESTQKVPWATPASWEGGVPGMGSSAPQY